MLVPLQYLKEVFKIDETSKTGLRWKKRANDKFGWNKKYANKPAGTFKLSKDGIPAWRVNLTYNGVPKLYYVHRIIFYIKHGFLDDNKVIDHINGNPLDNRVRNLRQVTFSQNSFNSKLNKKNKLKCKNIYLLKDGTYLVRLTINKKNIYIGKYTNLKDAKKAARKARIKYHGEFARHK
jgi:hypothetical protein